MELNEKIEPTLLFSVLCDDVRREDNGKFILIGLFETIGAIEFPARHPVMYVMNCWCSGLGEFTQWTRILNPDGSKFIEEEQKTRFVLTDLCFKHRVVARFNNLLFEQPGEYHVEILLNGELKVRYPLVIEKVSPPQQI